MQSIRHISFILSYEKDFEGYLKLTEQISRDVLNDELKKKYPEFNQNDTNSIRELLFNQFGKQKDEIEERMIEVEKQWLCIEDAFYQLSFELFKHLDFNKRYIAYPSLLSHFIRDLDNGLISFPATQPPNHGVFVICHELLHFFFFDHLAADYPALRGKGTKNLVWPFSEVLNVLIQEQERWVALTDITPSYYPQQKELYELMRPHWLKEKC